MKTFSIRVILIFFSSFYSGAEIYGQAFIHYGYGFGGRILIQQKSQSKAQFDSLKRNEEIGFTLNAQMGYQKKHISFCAGYTLYKFQSRKFIPEIINTPESPYYKDTYPIHTVNMSLDYSVAKFSKRRHQIFVGTSIDHNFRYFRKTLTFSQNGEEGLSIIRTKPIEPFPKFDIKLHTQIRFIVLYNRKDYLYVQPSYSFSIVKYTTDGTVLRPYLNIKSNTSGILYGAFLNIGYAFY